MAQVLPIAAAGQVPVVFDCDGTLVDSERIYAASDVAVLNAHGIPLTLEFVYHNYTGVILTDIIADIEQRYAVTLPDSVLAEMQAEVDVRMERDLVAIDGVPDLLAMLASSGHALAVASNSSSVGVARSLRVTGLDSYFPGRVATADQVERGKPHPDVYLRAAGLLGAVPERCVAVEDSPTGIRAAKAAGMFAIGFTDAGHAHAPGALRSAGADLLISRMSELGPLLMPA